MNFNELPIEIIQIIFYIHVYEHIGSKRTLLRTCQAWYNVASNYATLWRAIHWHSSDSTMVHPDDQCINLNDLAQVIGRTATLTFDLVIPFPDIPPSTRDQRRFASEVDLNWLSRCRSLSLCQPNGFPDSVQRTVNAILGPMDSYFPSLEHLSISEMGMDLDRWDGALDTLIGRVADSSTNLQSLGLFSRWDPWGIEGRVFHFPDMLRRIRRLQLKSLAPIPWAEFPNLEHLDYAVFSEFRSQSLSKLVAPRLTSLCLEGVFEDAELPPHALFNQLTHMVLRNFYSKQTKQGRAFPTSFSRLSSVGLENHHRGGWFEHIQTEKPLEELILANGSKTGYEHRLSIATFRPRVLRVDIMLDLPSYCGIGEPISLWNHVEEIHVIVKEDALWDWFTLALSKPAGDQDDSRECYPLLRVLTVLYPDKDQDSEQKQEQMERLHDIQRGRHKSGIRLLETLKVGWYHPNDPILTIPYAGRHVTQWRDCLEDWSPQGRQSRGF